MTKQQSPVTIIVSGYPQRTRTAACQANTLRKLTALKLDRQKNPHINLGLRDLAQVSLYLGCSSRLGDILLSNEGNTLAKDRSG